MDNIGLAALGLFQYTLISKNPNFQFALTVIVLNFYFQGLYYKHYGHKIVGFEDGKWFKKQKKVPND